MGLGSFELVTLAEARDAAFANRRIARRGGDPFAERRRSSAPQVVDAQAVAWKQASRIRMAHSQPFTPAPTQARTVTATTRAPTPSRRLVRRTNALLTSFPCSTTGRWQV